VQYTYNNTKELLRKPRRGSKRLFVKLSDVTSFTASTSTNEITSLELQTPFTEIECPRNTIGFTVGYSIDEFGIEEYTHSVNFTVPRRQASTAFALQAYIEANPSLVCMVKDTMGRYILLGLENGLNVTSVDGGSGTDKPSGPNYQISLEGIERGFEYEVPFSAVTSNL